MEIEKWVGRKVGDQIVVTAGTALTPLNNGAPYKKAVRLTLDNGVTLFGCVWDECEFTANNPTSVASGHWKVHEMAPDLRRVPFKDWTLEQILGRLMDAEDDIQKLLGRLEKANGRGRNKDVEAELRRELQEAKTKIRDFERAFAAFGKLLPNAPQ